MKKIIVIILAIISLQVTAQDKQIDFKKLAEFNIPIELSEAFELLTLNNMNDIFQLPDLKSKSNRMRTKENNIEESLEDFDDQDVIFLENEILNSENLTKLDELNENDKESNNTPLPIILEEDESDYIDI